MKLNKENQMLVLGRRVGDSIMIADNIEIVVLSAKNNVAKIGIVAPEEVNIVRSELLERAVKDEG